MCHVLRCGLGRPCKAVGLAASPCGMHTIVSIARAGFSAGTLFSSQGALRLPTSKTPAREAPASREQPGRFLSGGYKQLPCSLGYSPNLKPFSGEHIPTFVPVGRRSTYQEADAGVKLPPSRSPTRATRPLLGHSAPEPVTGRRGHQVRRTNRRLPTWSKAPSSSERLASSTVIVSPLIRTPPPERSRRASERDDASPSSARMRGR